METLIIIGIIVLILIFTTKKKKTPDTSPVNDLTKVDDLEIFQKFY